MRALQTLAFAFVAGIAAAQEQRDGRVLSLFNLVQFKTIECQATENEDGGAYSGLMGTCLTSTECSDRGGDHKGNCAQGFGVCCVKQIKGCTGQTVSHNNTYIANEGYPTVLAANVARSCAYTVTRDGDICQLRLDFDDVVLVPGANGLSTVAGAMGSISVAGGSGIDPPVVTGLLTGDHMYVEVHATDPVITITTLANALAVSQKWNIRVQQVACDSEWKAPRDCTQWFTASSGTVRSYNSRDATAANNKELTDQSMTICIRQNAGMCGVTLSAETFSVGDATAAAGQVGNTAGTAAMCNMNWEGAVMANNNHGALIIPGAGIFCQGAFSALNDQAASTPVTVKNGPVTLTHLTDSVANSEASRGFVLNYIQI